MGAAAEPDPLVGRRVSNYQIIERLGAGGMGVVYRAIDQKLERPVALKFLPVHLSSGTEKSRFLREARAASALDHQNIGVIHGIEETADGQLFIVMTCYEGETLFQRLERGSLGVFQSVELALQMARGLAAAHAKGIVHRDIKPGNVMITRQGVVKVLDFGLAKFADSETLTLSGMMLGTAAYMSPEQALGRAVDHRSDIWSLGLVLHEMLAGKRPFRRDNTPSTMMAIVNDPPPALDQVPAELQAVVYRCLAKDPERRYQQVEQLADDLVRLQIRRDAPTETLAIHVQQADLAWEAASTPAMERPPTRRPDPKPARARRVAAWSALAMLVAAGAWFGSSRWSKGLLVPREKHVAVLPFTNIGGDPANAAICDGILETLTSRLSTLERVQESLWVAPASEVRRRNISDAAAARRAFGANLVVTGGVQRDANSVRLTVSLIDTQTMRQLGSAVIDDRFGNFSALQDNAVATLAKLLEVELNPNTLPKANGESATPAAYESYLKGLSYLQRYDKVGNLDTAIQLFDDAVKRDPRFALAYARLAEAERIKYRLTKDSRLLDRALSDGRRAAQINDQLAPVHVTLAQIHAEAANHDLAMQEFQRALQLDPRNAEAHMRIASTYESQGRTAEAEASLKKSIALRPDYWEGHNSLGVFYYRRTKYSEAAAQFRKVLDLTPDNAGAWINLGVMLNNMRDPAGARQAYEKALAIAPSYAAYSNVAGIYYNEANYIKAAEMYEKALQINDRDYRPWGGLASAYSAAGIEAKARPALQRAVAIAEDEAAKRPSDASILSYLASYYAKLGVREKAITRIETASVLAPEDQRILYMASLVHETLGNRAGALKSLKAALERGYPAAAVQQDPDLRKLREDPAFRSLMK